MFTPDYKKGFKGYRNGFLTGLLLGFGVCLFYSKIGWPIPVFFALVGGAIGFQLKIRENG